MTPRMNAKAVMMIATLLGIFVYPALYYFVGRIGNFERRRERKKQEEKL